jgi:hypothetical protein
MKKLITLNTFLRELARDIYSVNSKRVTSKLSYKLTTLQCLVLHIYATNGAMTEDFRPSRQNLVKLGLMYHVRCPDGTRAANGQIKHIFRLTDKGESLHQEILEKFTPIVDRINDRIREEAIA